jgi:hypothetical protein
VDAFQLLVSGQWSRIPHHFVNQSTCGQLIVDSLKPGRALGVICAHFMKQAVGVRNKCSMHTVFLLILKPDSSLAVKDKLFFQAILFQAILLEPLIPQSPG